MADLFEVEKEKENSQDEEVLKIATTRRRNGNSKERGEDHFSKNQRNLSGHNWDHHKQQCNARPGMVRSRNRPTTITILIQVTINLVPLPEEGQLLPADSWPLPNGFNSKRTVRSSGSRLPLNIIDRNRMKLIESVEKKHETTVKKNLSKAVQFQPQSK